MTRWFRVYEDVVDDPKVQQLSPELFRIWVNLLCLSSKNEGRLPVVSDIAFALRLRLATAKKALAQLVAAGLIDTDDTGYFPHNWAKRQFRSDDVAERVRRHRSAQKKPKCNIRGNVTGNVTSTVTGNVTVTPPDSDSDSDTLPNGNDGKPSDPPHLRLWIEGKASLASMGVAPKLGGQMIGRWLRDAGDDHQRVLDAIERARDMVPADAVPWITAHLKPPDKPNGKARAVYEAALDNWVREQQARH